jgi:TPR repeat protein
LQGLALEEAHNFLLARDMYELAREGPTQHPSACIRLWDFYQYGRPGIIRNFNRAYSCARSGALSLCVHCSGALSLHMAFGWGMSEHDICSGLEKVDVLEALRLATSSSQRGSAYGQYALATFYFGGVGVSKNHKEMFSLYSKAAEQGLGRAKLALGACYKDGIGVQVNLKLAAKFFEEASHLGVVGAAFLLQSVRDQINLIDN